MSLEKMSFVAILSSEKCGHFVFYWTQVLSQQSLESTISYCIEAMEVIYFSVEDRKQLETYGGEITKPVLLAIQP